MCLVTPYSPEASFTAAGTMGRNKLIYALARHMLVVCADKDHGGTWAGANEALKARYGDVLVWRGAGEGPVTIYLSRAAPRASATWRCSPLFVLHPS